MQAWLISQGVAIVASLLEAFLSHGFTFGTLATYAGVLHTADHIQGKVAAK